MRGRVDYDGAADPEGANLDYSERKGSPATGETSSTPATTRWWATGRPTAAVAPGSRVVLDSD